VDRQPPAELPEGYVDFYKQLESWQNEQTIKLRKTFIHHTQDIEPLLNSRKKPLLMQVRHYIDEKDFNQVYRALIAFLYEARPNTALYLDSIMRGIDAFSFEQIIESLIKLDDKYLQIMATQLNISEEFLYFTLDHSLRPFLRLIAEHYTDALKSETLDWEFYTICPVCGAKSHISRLRSEDGQRLMFCDRCFSEWPSRFLFCVHCGADKPGSLSFIKIEGDDAYQLFVCEKCKGYLKTYDERVGGKSVDLFIANVETVYLDMLAQERGYTNHD